MKNAIKIAKITINFIKGAQMKTVSIVNMGCKVNLYEADKIAGILACSGFSVDFGLKPADIYVLNTCAVTNEGERKSRNMLTKLLKLNPNASVYVCGCASQNNSQNFTTNPNVKYVIGTQNKDQLAYQICADFGVACVYTTNQISSRTRGVLKCQDGCNNFCSYCLIPYLRGREVSRPLADLVAELDQMQKAGVNEVVLTGINLSAYGRDLNNGTGFIDLAKMFENRPMRYRFSSLEVNVVTEELISYLSTQPNFCDHFHLSMQSGCNHTLKKMNRHYTKEDYLQRVALIRKYFPNAGITTDVIVGFPTEKDEHFEETYNTCKQANFAEMHIFVYSKRAGTVAEKFKNEATNVKQRAEKLAQLNIKNKAAFIKQNIGKTYQIIVENKKGDYLTGHTPNYIMCYIKGDYNSNDIVKVKILQQYLDGAIAEVIEK